jgi:hypothetical protein
MILPGTPKQVIELGCAWISPEGDIYPCRGFEHVNLSVKLEKQVGYPAQSFEERGWVRLIHGGVWPIDPNAVPQRALGAVVEIVKAGPRPDLEAWLARLT